MSKTCFVISVIGHDGSDERAHADKLFKHIIEPVAKAAGYASVVRGDHIDRAGNITTQVVEAIWQSDLVVADLSFPNPNVYYELAIRHGTGKAMVQMMKAGTALPFDVGQVRTVPFGFDIDLAEAAKIELQKKVAAAEADTAPMQNPITQARKIDEVAASNIDNATILSELLNGQAKLLDAVKRIQSNLGSERRALLDGIEKQSLIRDVYENSPSAKNLASFLLAGADALGDRQPQRMKEWAKILELAKTEEPSA